jgi:hypothetical protein
MMNGLQSITQWDDYFGKPRGGKIGLLNAIQVRSLCSAYTHPTDPYPQNIGALAGYPFAPYVADYFGRRPSIFLGALIMCGATALQTASKTVGMFIAARCVTERFLL